MIGCLSAQAPPFSAGLAVLSDGSSLLFNVLLDDRQWSPAAGCGEVRREPQVALVGANSVSDSLSGKRTGRKAGRPRLRSRKDNRQSIRLTRNGFTVTPRGVRVAKVGDLRVEWSRSLPSVPSSVTIIREADGRYYASFVVAVQATPLPVVTSDIGVEIVNACGADVRPGPTPAVGDEAGTYRGAA